MKKIHCFAQAAREGSDQCWWGFPLRAEKGLYSRLLLLALVFLQQPVLADDSNSSPQRALASSVQQLPSPALFRRASFGDHEASTAVRTTANWVIDSGDNLGMPFIVVDKQQGSVFMFAADGHLRAATAALLGLAVGDDTVPGIGERSLSSILPEERITPAGRFVASLGHNLQGKQILWVEYASALSLHPVVTSNIKERRDERLNSADTSDNRISFGCINVPEEFFNDVVSESFKSTNGVVYVLPETRTNHAVFASYYDVE